MVFQTNSSTRCAPQLSDIRERQLDGSQDSVLANAEIDRREFLRFTSRGLLAATAGAAVAARLGIWHDVTERVRRPREVWDKIRNIAAHPQVIDRVYSIAYLNAFISSVEHQQVARQLVVPDSEFKHSLRTIADAFMRDYQRNPEGDSAQNNLKYICVLAQMSEVPVHELVSPEQFQLAVRRQLTFELRRIREKIESTSDDLVDVGEIAEDFYKSISELSRLTGVPTEEVGLPKAHLRTLLFPLLSSACKHAPPSDFWGSAERRSLPLRYLLTICELGSSEIHLLPDVQRYQAQYAHAFEQLQGPQEDFYLFEKVAREHWPRRHVPKTEVKR